MNLEQTRFNMVEQQIRPWDVHQPQVLDALFSVKREQFVPKAQRDLAFMDHSIVLDNGATMLEPKVAARMVQALDLHPEDRVLQLGVGNGYMTALLSAIAAEVVCVSDNAAALDSAEQALQQAGMNNVELLEENPLTYCKKGGDFDAIVLHGSVSEVPVEILKLLGQKGRLVAVLGSGSMQELSCLTRDGSEVVVESIIDTYLPALFPDQKTSEFVF